jgi:hypothetical protein
MADGVRVLKELNSSDLVMSAHLQRISIGINMLERTGGQRRVEARWYSQRLAVELPPPLNLAVSSPNTALEREHYIRSPEGRAETVPKRGVQEWMTKHMF